MFSCVCVCVCENFPYSNVVFCLTGLALRHPALTWAPQIESPKP